MRTLALVLLVVGTVGCNSAITPTAPTLPAVAPVPPAQSLCAPPTARRVHTVPVPGQTTPAVVWLESISPPAGATVRVGDAYTVTHRQVTPSGNTVVVEWAVAAGAEAPRVFTVMSAGGCGSGVFRSHVLGSAGPLQLRVRIWVRPGDIAPPFTPAGPPDYEATEPLDWTVVS